MCPPSMRGLLLAAGLLLLAGCLSGKSPPVTAGQAAVDYDLLLDAGAAVPDWDSDVRPILDRRCVVCHACYDAPCQLKLSSWEGLVRGANPEKVYDGTRLRAAAPTRLYEDAHTAAEWRAKGFHPVLSDADEGGERHLENSVLYRMLRLKQLHPQPLAGMLPEEVTVDLDRRQVCTTEDGFESFARSHPLWGMPYGMPNLSRAEYRTLVQWLAAGAPPGEDAVPSAEAEAQIRAWEEFLNGESLRERLMSRYLYEHLFLGHLHLEGTPEREFFRLVRSRTPPGEPVDVLATVRPMDDPGPAPFWYRLMPERQTVVAKDHVVYGWSPARMARYRQLFLEPGYTVTALPSYDPATGANPLKAFVDIPVESRYRFMLDDARFFIESFIKGPVCRGQVALSVIEDRFWVFFFDPERAILTNRDEALAELANYLPLPAEQGNSLNVLRLWTRYWKSQKTYIAAKQEWFRQVNAVGLDDALGYVWNGEGTNPAAALTVLRHTDSAFVLDGLHGDYPETAWIIDYPLFERIHYLLVAGFDVYGNVGHQLSTRIVMDFLRMEGEDHFLAFLPAADRKTIRDGWYQGIRKRRAKEFREPMDWLQVESVIGYRSDDPQRELYDHLIRRLGTLAGTDAIHRCAGEGCDGEGNEARVRQALRRMAGLGGRHLLALPDAALLRVRDGAGEGQDLVYTLVVDKGYSNLTSLLEDEDRRSPDDDALTVVPGFAVSYPNLFLVADAGDIDAFADRFAAIRSRDDYERFVALYGVRRTDPRFWEDADWFQARYVELEPVEAGLLDLNRYWNR